MKYYTYCLFSPSGPSSSQGVVARYPNAPLGFVFHDDEKRLEPTELQWPLYSLYGLVKQQNTDETVQPRRAVLVRIDDHTIAACFSMSGFPKPHRWRPSWRWYKGQASREEGPLYPLPLDEASDDARTAHLTGWVISDVTTLRDPAVKVSFGDLYDQCTQLVKLTGDCPCDLLRTGECLETTVLPQLPESFLGPMRTTYDVEAKWLTRKRYHTLGGFEYVKPGHTIQSDFGKAVRPWDTHDFGCVEERKEELAARGKLRSRNHAFRQENCTKCALTEKHWRTKAVTGCSDLRYCTNAVTEEEVWKYFDWRYDTLGFEDMYGFTPAQRDYLIHLGKYPILSSAITGARHIPACIAGFAREGHRWKLLISPTRGRKDRTVALASYQELLDTTRFEEPLPMGETLPECAHVTRKVRMAVALMGERTWAWAHGKGTVPVYQNTWSSTFSEGCVTRSGARSSPYTIPLGDLEVRGSAKHWQDILGIRSLDIVQWVHSPTAA